MRVFAVPCWLKVDWKPGQSIIIDGIRHTSIVDVLQQVVYPSKFYLIFISIDEGLRRQRIKTQRAEEMHQEAQIEGHSTEIQTITFLPRLADITIDGNSSLDEASKHILDWLEENL